MEEILRKRLLRPVYQPIVDLETRDVFGYEALARGPAGSAEESSAGLFAAAAARGRLVELDSACQAAVEGALALGVASPLTLFVNVEPDTIGIEPLPPIRPGLRALVELTERALTSRLADLMPALQAARAQGWGVALDDVGADTRSLALMPLLRPDVITLDLRLVKQHATPELAARAPSRPCGAPVDSTRSHGSQSHPADAPPAVTVSDPTWRLETAPSSRGCHTRRLEGSLNVSSAHGMRSSAIAASPAAMTGRRKRVPPGAAVTAGVGHLASFIRLEALCGVPFRVPQAPQTAL